MSDPDQPGEELDEAVGESFPPDRAPRLDDDGGTEPEVWERRYTDDDGVELGGDADIDIGGLDEEGELVGQVVGEDDHGPLAPDDEFSGDETTRDIAPERAPRAAEDAAVHIQDD
jgi:hypothetical protein